MWNYNNNNDKISFIECYIFVVVIKLEHLTWLQFDNIDIIA